jgi:hypothetical protein
MIPYNVLLHFSDHFGLDLFNRVPKYAPSILREQLLHSRFSSRFSLSEYFDLIEKYFREIFFPEANNYQILKTVLSKFSKASNYTSRRLLSIVARRMDITLIDSSLLAEALEWSNVDTPLLISLFTGPTFSSNDDFIQKISRSGGAAESYHRLTRDRKNWIKDFCLAKDFAKLNI